MFICMQKTRQINKMKRSSFLTSFLRYCKGFANMLFCEIWKCLTILIKNHSINLKETFMLIYMQKINLSLISFLQYCRRNNIFVILGNLGMHSHTHKPKSIKSTPSFTLSLRYCKLVTLGTLGMPATHTQQDTINL